MEFLTTKEIGEKYGFNKWVLIATQYGSEHAFYIQKDNSRFEYAVNNVATNYIVHFVDNPKSARLFNVLDWFEENGSPVNNGECKCNIIDLLKVGCACGSITRYSPPSL